MMPGFEIFNACSGLSVSLNELFVELETVTGRPLARMYDSARRVDASDIAMSPALAAQRYDWLHATSLREGFQRTWAWPQEQGDDRVTSAPPVQALLRKPDQAITQQPC